MKRKSHFSWRIEKTTIHSFETLVIKSHVDTSRKWQRGRGNIAINNSRMRWRVIMAKWIRWWPFSWKVIGSYQSSMHSLALLSSRTSIRCLQKRNGVSPNKYGGAGWTVVETVVLACDSCTHSFYEFHRVG